MRKVILSLLSIYSVVASIAQNPYNFKAKYSFGYSNSILHLTNISQIKPNHHTFTFQRVLNPKTTIFLNYSLARELVDFNSKRAITQGVVVYDMYHRKTIEEGYKADNNNYYYRSNNYEFGLRKFLRFKGAIAPYGYFIEIKMGHSNLTRNAKDTIVYNPPLGNNQKGGFPNSGINHYKLFNTSIGFGDNRVLVKNISFTWLITLNLNIPRSQITTLQRTKNGSGLEVLNSDEYFFFNAKQTYQKNNLLNISLGLNYSF